MQKAIIDLSKNGIIPVFHAKQGDTSRRVAITLLDNGLPYDTAADAVSVWYRGPSGAGNYSDGIDKDGSTLTILVNPNMTAASGRHTCAVMLSNENGRCTTWNFCVEVAYTPALGSEEAKAYFEAFEAGELAADIAAVDARTAKAVAELNARVSSIIASGTATEGNTELIDIRTGADGKVYPTAGDAVREQVGGIKGDLVDLTNALKEEIFLPKSEHLPISNYRFYKTLYGKYTSDKSFEEFDSISNICYVSRQNGRDLPEAIGTKEDPFGTINYALNRNPSGDLIIYIDPSKPQYASDISSLNRLELNNRKIKIASSNNTKKVKIVGCFWDELSWEIDNGIYKTQAQFGVNMIYDESHKDYDGLLIPYKIMESKSEVVSTQYSFAVIDGYLYVNNNKTTAPTLSDGHYLMFDDSAFSFIMINNSKILLENVHLLNNTYQKNPNGSYDVLYVAGDETCEFIQKNTVYEGGVDRDGIYGNGLLVVSCQTYSDSCISAYINGDGFNYNTPYYNEEQSRRLPFIELNCKAYKCGDPTKSGTSNASTSHVGTNVIRIGCYGYDTAGPTFADVGGGKVINYDCTVIPTFNDYNYYGFEIESNPDRQGYMWIIDGQTLSDRGYSVGVGLTTENNHAYIQGLKSILDYTVGENNEFITNKF